MTAASSTLVAHRGAKKISRSDLASLPTPAGNDSWKPVPHNVLVSTLIEEFNARGYSIIKEEFAVQRGEGDLLFGVFDLRIPSSTGDYTGSFGFRTSNDKTLGLRGVAGARVFVCDNLALSGDEIVLKRRHTSNLEIRWECVQTVVKFAERFPGFVKHIDDMKDYNLSDLETKELIYNAFCIEEVMPNRLLPVVHKEYFDPSFEDFKAEKNLWRLNNAFTYAAKNLKTQSQMDSLNRIGQFFARILS